jgi:hypothetical protein
MSFIPMLVWWQWLLLAAVPPAIVLLYFLKLKRQPLEVPSTYLWRRSIEDLHVNSIWQRLRKNLLLLLQLLIVLLAILALLRPGWRGTKLLDTRLIFLVDNSASMSSTDVAPTRLDDAKRQVGDLIDQMDSGAVAMLISFSDSARVEQSFTDNRRLLRRQLDAIRPTNRSTRLGEALRVAAGLANPNRSFESEGQQVGEALPATMYIFSDGKFPDVEGFSLGNLKPVFVPIGEATAKNVGITAFSTKEVEGKADHVQAFARLENHGPQDVATEVELYLDDALKEAEAVTMKAGESAGVVFDLADLHSGVLELKTGAGGDLPLDDVAWAVVNPPERGKTLLVTPGNDALELALKTERAGELAEISIAGPEALETPAYQKSAAAGGYRLIIYDQCRPAELPAANTLFVGRIPASGWSAGEKSPAPQVIDVDNAHPLMQLIDLGNVRFAEGTPLKGPPGSTVLIDSNAGPLLAIAPREGYEDAVLGVEIVSTDEKGERYANTDWPLRLSFPVFVLNALEYLAAGSDASGAGSVGASVSPGRPMTLRSQTNAERLMVVAPGGKSTAVERGKLSAFHFSDTDELGVYEVREGGKLQQQFAVNLFDGAESDIRPRAQNAVKIGFVEVAGQSGNQAARQELWRPLLLAALFVLLLEWYIYNRRVYL